MSDITMSSQSTSAAVGLGRAWHQRPLTLALAVDAAVTAANGAAYLLAAGPLGDLLGLSPALLRGTGGFLLAFAALVAVAARSGRPAPALVSEIVAVNAVWAVGSVVVAAVGWGSPTTAGTAWIAMQGVAVGALGSVQAVAMRRGRSVA